MKRTTRLQQSEHDVSVAERNALYVARSVVRKEADVNDLRLALGVLDTALSKLSRVAAFGYTRSKPSTESDGGEGGGTSLTHLTTGTKPDEKEGEERKTTTPPSEARPALLKVTWLTPYYDLYAEVYREVPQAVTCRRMARTFREIERTTAREEVVARFGRYLRATRIKYYSVENFAHTFAGWRDGFQEPSDPRSRRTDETMDQYADRLAAM